MIDSIARRGVGVGSSQTVARLEGESKYGVGRASPVDVFNTQPSGLKVLSLAAVLWPVRKG